MLTTLEGYHLRASVLGHSWLTAQLERRGAGTDPTALFGVVEGAFVTVIDQLTRSGFQPTELRFFADAAARLTAGGREPVTADEVDRIVRYEFGEAVDVRDIEARRAVPVRRAVVGTAVRRLKFTLHDVDNLLRRAENLAAQWGFATTGYHPGLITTGYLLVVETRWSRKRLRHRHTQLGQVL
ncbi:MULTISPECIES: hypothetical protein [unclassified Solwaraspora]|uniref:hypothetical protein n=1 Tax=unclassified Solwaraspora TaxID=2627926 RepID=UPI00259AED29|nr:hypothetical protein [Solwaraspora sp. WMMA2056]WJK38882.1 hypothetical protein O7608_20560 [Solwaraspora sp. WMMA2056]